MKTKEEIEQIANDKYLQRAEAISDSTIKGYIVSAVRGGFVDGYMQCQQDNDWTKNCNCKNSIGQTWCCNQCGLPYDTRKEQDWTNFEGELMDWAHNLGQEQKYIPYPAQFLEWLKNNYKLPQKK